MCIYILREIEREERGKNRERKKGEAERTSQHCQMTNGKALFSYDKKNVRLKYNSSHWFQWWGIEEASTAAGSRR